MDTSQPEGSQPESQAERRSIPNWPGYAVDAAGRVWTKRKRGIGHGLYSSWRELKQARGSDGRMQVSLYRGSHATGKKIRVYRLVLEAFVGPCPPGMECRHLNDIHSDNRLENLCWGTRLENAADAIRNGITAHGERHVRSLLTDEVAAAILKDHSEMRGDMGRVPNGSLDVLAARHGIARSTLFSLLYGRVHGA